jgi:ribosome-associated toxin RatA of RatAB toxin-antitoxin module
MIRTCSHLRVQMPKCAKVWLTMTERSKERVHIASTVWNGPFRLLPAWRVTHSGSGGQATSSRVAEIAA